MDADLSRRAGRAKNTPYYHYVGQETPEFDEQLTKILLKAGTFENLNPATQQFFRLCEHSYEIAQELGIRDWIDPDNLQQIIDRVVAEVPAEDVEVE